MKKKDTILISIIIILLISLVGTIIYYNQDKMLKTTGEVLVVGSNYLLVGTSDNEDYVIKTKDTNYQVGDKIELELTKLNKKKTPYEATAKNITIIKDEQANNSDNSNHTNNNSNNDNDITNNNLPSKEESTNNDKVDNNEVTNNKENNQSNNQSNNETESNSEQKVIKYFEDLNNEITTYNNNDETLGKTIKSKFVKCVDFLFYDEEINGKTFKELTNATKLKILEIAMIIDSKIESKFPGYKESINTSYQNIKTKIIEKYLETTTNICNNDPDLCITAKEGFNDLKENFGITWDVIKELAKNGVTKLKDWYEIWRYQ